MFINGIGSWHHIRLSLCTHVGTHGQGQGREWAGAWQAATCSPLLSPWPAPQCQRSCGAAIVWLEHWPCQAGLRGLGQGCKFGSHGGSRLHGTGRACTVFTLSSPPDEGCAVVLSRGQQVQTRSSCDKPKGAMRSSGPVHRAGRRLTVARIADCGRSAPAFQLIEQPHSTVNYKFTTRLSLVPHP
jgi:hypothetical protein